MLGTALCSLLLRCPGTCHSPGPACWDRRLHTHRGGVPTVPPVLKGCRAPACDSQVDVLHLGSANTFLRPPRDPPVKTPTLNWNASRKKGNAYCCHLHVFLMEVSSFRFHTRTLRKRYIFYKNHFHMNSFLSHNHHAYSFLRDRTLLLS